MQLTIFGATGRTGRLVVSQALDQQYAVVRLARDADRIGIRSPLLRAIQGSLNDPDALALATTGSDAVISVLGPSRNKPVYEISAATARIIETMQRCGVRRLVMTSGAGVRDPNDSPPPVDRLMGALVKMMAHHVYEDMRRSVEAVRSSDLDWTIVRVPILVDGPSTGHVRAGYVGKGIGLRVTRADLARFVLSQVSDRTYLHQAPAISN